MISRQMENLERNCMIYKSDEKHISGGGIMENGYIIVGQNEHVKWCILRR